MNYTQNPYPYPGVYSAPEKPERVFRRRIRKDTNRLSFGILAAIFLMSGMYLVFSLILSAAGYPFASTEKYSGMTQEMYFLVSCLYYLVGVFAPFLFILIVSKQDPSEAVPVNKTKPSVFILLVLFGFGICLAANIPTNFVAAFLTEIGLNGSMPPSDSPTSIMGTVLYAVNIAIIPALVEEFAFRGIILSRLSKYGNGFAVFASAILFALYHGNIIQFVFAFICGLIFGFIVVKTGNIFITMLIHAVNNGFSVFSELIYQYMDTASADMISNISFFAFIAIGLIALIILLVRHRELFSVSKSQLSFHTSLKFGAFLTNPGFIALLLYFVFMSVQFLTMK